LFLEGKDSFYYQIFIEPKGNWAKDKNNELKIFGRVEAPFSQALPSSS